MSVVDSLISSLIDILGATAIVWSAIWSITYLQRKAGQVMGKFIYIPGVIGVPIHELSHAGMALLMGHKITKVSLFHPQKDGTLGFVEHSYRANMLAPFRNLLIALAPFAGGGLVFYGLTLALVPSAAEALSVQFSQATSSTDALAMMGAVIREATSVGGINAWLWVFLATSVLLFCVPSTADFAGTRKAIAITIIGVMTISVIAPTLGGKMINMAYFMSLSSIPWLVGLNTFMLVLLLVVVVISNLTKKKTSKA